MVDLASDILDRYARRVGSLLRRKYRLDVLLGVGGMAAVYAATHRNGTRAAIKVLHGELARIPEIRERFLREGYVANRIGHPGVVRILDDDDDDETRTVFLVMELLQGQTLQARWEESGRMLPLGQVLGFADRMLDVLAAAHEQGVVHRDVKPDNLFLTTAGELKVLDLGIARLLDGTGATKSGELLGTPGFMAPEQANGNMREIDGRTDLWSVGAVIFALVTGEEVHSGKNPAAQAVYAATQAARPIESLRPGIPRDVAMLVNRALSFERRSRWESARAMQAALRATRAYDVLAATVGAAPTLLPSGPPPTERMPFLGGAAKTIVQGSDDGET